MSKKKVKKNENNNHLKHRQVNDTKKNNGKNTNFVREIKISENTYDDFLKNEKQGRYIRVGKWKGMHKNTLHKCTDKECEREWSPSPSQSYEDDYFCPSCVLHHRNNVERFNEPRLKWTAKVPNTFYVYELTDPNSKDLLIKFGRTQNKDANKRYSLQERTNYKMKLIFSLRGDLEKMTKIENMWKDEATLKNLFKRFTNEKFHGLTETLKNENKEIMSLIEKSKILANS